MSRPSVWAGTRDRASSADELVERIAARTAELVQAGQRKADVPLLALKPAEAAAALGVSRDYFDQHVNPELAWVRRGRLKLVAIAELQRWLEREAELALPARTEAPYAGDRARSAHAGER